jgi:hypothetical protein
VNIYGPFRIWARIWTTYIAGFASVLVLAQILIWIYKAEKKSEKTVTDAEKESAENQGTDLVQKATGSPEIESDPVIGKGSRDSHSVCWGRGTCRKGQRTRYSQELRSQTVDFSAGWPDVRLHKENLGCGHHEPSRLGNDDHGYGIDNQVEQYPWCLLAWPRSDN